MSNFTAAYYSNAQRANCDKLFRRMFLDNCAKPTVTDRTVGTILTQLENAVRIAEAAHKSKSEFPALLMHD